MVGALPKSDHKALVQLLSQSWQISAQPPGGWLCAFPNLAGFCLCYAKLLETY